MWLLFKCICPFLSSFSQTGNKLEWSFVRAFNTDKDKQIKDRYLFHLSCIPSKGRLSGWIATFRYALATSNLAISDPRPRAMMPLITASTETYCTVKRGLGMPSFTLCPTGEERSRMRCHLPGWLFLGMTPKWLICREGKGGAEKGPATLQEETSVCK